MPVLFTRFKIKSFENRKKWRELLWKILF